MEVNITMHPIGVVASPITAVEFTEWSDVLSEIRLDNRLMAGLRGLEEYSHIVVVFYLDRVHFQPTKDLVRHPRDRADWPLTGVFATRTQYRPNPIGVTTVQLMGITRNVLTVKGLDTLDGTPVLDIKPYLPDLEIAQAAVAPQWLR